MWVDVHGTKVSLWLGLPQEEFKLGVEEAQQRSAGCDLSVTVVDHQSVVAQILAVDALGARGQRHHLGVSKVQPCLILTNSSHDCNQIIQVSISHNQED